MPRSSRTTVTGAERPGRLREPSAAGNGRRTTTTVPTKATTRTTRRSAATPRRLSRSTRRRGTVGTLTPRLRAFDDSGGRVGMSVDDLGGVLLLASAVLLVAVVAVRISVRSGFPSLLLYFGLGLLIGERGLGIRFDDARLTGVLGYAALLVILAEGGLTTRWSTIRPVVPAAAVLATVGTGISVAVTAVAAHLV